MSVIKVPAFLLRRLYVKGSLRPLEGGFTFQLKNTLGSGYARAMLPMQVDGREAPFDRSYFSIDGMETPFTAVAEKTPFTLAMNRTVTLGCRDFVLQPGPHKVSLGFVVVGLGEMRFDVTDQVV